MTIDEYVYWDAVLNRWDITNKAIVEQRQPKVRAIIDTVLRSWFIPVTATQLRLKLGETEE